MERIYNCSVFEKAPTHNNQDILQSSSKEAGENKESRKRARAIRRAELQIGQEFRPYDLFDEIAVLPAELLSSPLLTSLEKLTWALVSKRLGKEGAAYPSYSSIARDLGVSERQAKRAIRGLEKKRFLRSLIRSPCGGRRSSNEYRLLWHQTLAKTGIVAKTTVDDPTGSVTPTLRRTDGDNLSPEKNHLHHQETSKTKRKKKSFSTSECQVVPAAERRLGFEIPIVTLGNDNRKRGLYESSEEEFVARLQERGHADAIGGRSILEIVLEVLVYDSAKLQGFLEFDELHTGAPKLIANPGGYYRRLAERYVASEESRRVAARRQLDRELAKNSEKDAPNRKPCSLRRCDGSGEIYDERGLNPCDCEIGRALPAEVRDLMEKINWKSGLEQESVKKG